MYNINNYQNGHCLSYDIHDVGFPSLYLRYPTIGIKEIISYCFRTEEEGNSMINFDFQNRTDPKFTFGELRQKNITSQNLLSWSASIDTAEQYQIFLNNYSNSSSEKDKEFYNCTSSWFGPFCQFQFDYQIDKSFRDTISSIFLSKDDGYGSKKFACYKHLPYCETLLSCLDWRDICDKKNDCLDGSDEENCWQLEVNECSKNEYRCYNGQCIPIEFLHDIIERPDCMDQTDEPSRVFHSCPATPSFECEEHTCRPGRNEFSCADGDCINEISKCENGRNSFLPNTFCSNLTACSIERYDLVDYEWCSEFCSEANCVKDDCLTVYELSILPLLFGHVRFLISNKTDSIETILPDYVCYDAKLCAHFSSSVIWLNNLTCRHFNDFELSNVDLYDDLGVLIDSIKNQFRGCLVTAKETHYCNYSTMYRCENSSKCISKYRLLDGILDCPFNDDETFHKSCSLNDVHQRFKCWDSENEKCFAQIAVENSKIDCKYGEDEYEKDIAFIRMHINFQTICDGTEDLLPILIDDKDETDETECQQWQCNNTYTRCDGFWLCKDGSDEINCPHSMCPKGHHECVCPNDTSKVSCLTIVRAGDDNDDCLGGTDERTTKQYEIVHGFSHNLISYKFQCRNDTELISIDQLCDSTTDCLFNDDEEFCNNSSFAHMKLCEISEEFLTDAEIFFCKFGKDIILPRPAYFKLYDILTYPPELVIGNTSITQSTQTETHSIEKDPKVNQLSDVVWWCNRGVPIRFRMSDNTSTLSCLCPPSYYGNRCQYQNQRVSLTVQVRASSDWGTIFIFLITLIDNERNIHSHDHIEYLPIRDCRNKYNIYLLYSTRPKNLSKTYSVQIDMFNQKTMDYRASWIFPLQFPFLPVHRLAVSLKLPFSNIIFARQKCSLPCFHGQCYSYVNDQNSVFCRCEAGWSGAQCNIKYNCHCGTGALCMSDTICLCPVGQFGPLCHLFQSFCDSESCLNNGICIPFDVRYTDTKRVDLACICPEGYVGDFCEYEQEQTQIDISFDSSSSIPSFLLVHLITVRDHYSRKLDRTSIAKKIQFDQHSLTLYTPTSFNIAFAQIMNQYYLIILHEQTIIAAHISTKVIPSHRCRSIEEVFNGTFANQHLLKRIKYYHIPCQKDLELVCFYDKVYICLCTFGRTANCFEFDHNMTYDCDKDNYCGDNGDCFQDDDRCATSSFCACHICHFGSRCQFSTRGSALSLDIILGYHIRLETGISQQPIIVKIATALTIIILIVGCINSFLIFQTFRRKETHNVGCGFYLFMSSIISMITVIGLLLKFVFLMASHMGSIKNRTFLYLQCATMDFLLRLLVSINDWLSACVSIERAISVIHGVTFDKAKSKKMAKWITIILVLFTGCTYIYDPLHRHMMDDEDEQRIWCLIQYSSSVQLVDWLFNIFHFSAPFFINCISAVIIMIITARTRSKSQQTKSYKKHLREQLHHHKHLFISPMILIALAVPRLVISFLPGCMKSSRDSWFYLVGYFISFIPSIITFIIFVLPSKMYMGEFIKTMKRIW